jgi:methylglutaconyl-CoA hydratase
VNDFAEKLAAKPVSAIALFKRLLYQIDALPFSAALESGIQVNAIARMSDDCRRGVDRFLRKK